MSSGSSKNSGLTCDKWFITGGICVDMGTFVLGIGADDPVPVGPAIVDVDDPVTAIVDVDDPVPVGPATVDADALVSATVGADAPVPVGPATVGADALGPVGPFTPLANPVGGVIGGPE